MPAELFWYDNCIKAVSTKNCFETNLKQRRKKNETNTKNNPQKCKEHQG